MPIDLTNSATPSTRSYRGCGRVAPASLRARLRAAITNYGLAEVSRRASIGTGTLLRALGGTGVRHGSLLAIELGLTEIERELGAAEASPPPAPTGESKAS